MLLTVEKAVHTIAEDAVDVPVVVVRVQRIAPVIAVKDVTEMVIVAALDAIMAVEVGVFVIVLAVPVHAMAVVVIVMPMAVKAHVVLVVVVLVEIVLEHVLTVVPVPPSTGVNFIMIIF